MFMIYLHVKFHMFSYNDSLATTKPKVKYKFHADILFYITQKYYLDISNIFQRYINMLNLMALY
jgi:hypothetical protein